MLIKAMSQSSNEFEIFVFRSFVEKPIALYKQLDTSYRTNGFLSDHLLTSVDLPSIQKTLRDRILRRRKQDVHRISNQLNDKTKSAGSASACVEEYDNEGNRTDTEVMCSLEKLSSVSPHATRKPRGSLAKT